MARSGGFAAGVLHGVLLVSGGVNVLSCDGDKPTTAAQDAGVAVPASSVERPKPVVLYLPDGGDIAPNPRPNEWPNPGLGPPEGRRCPEEMVDVGGQFCIDRYEIAIVDKATGRRASPYYAPNQNLARRNFERFRQMRPQGTSPEIVDLQVPLPQPWQLEPTFVPRAVSERGVVPAGYLSELMAKRACEEAGKRLCSADEWTTACRGEQKRQYPYGESYEQGACNVFRDAHPAAVLHGNASLHHHDPRLNLVAPGGRPLLRTTGSTPRCRSVWGDDAIYDMVGNLDEWVNDDGGSFHGGFYSRMTREGCSSRITSHDASYSDYSLGTRCCL